MMQTKRMTGIALAIALMTAVVLLGVPSHAVAEEYGYTVRVFSGNKGSVNGEEVASFKVSKGEEIDLTEAVSVGIGDSSYYHKGFREAGQDDEFPYRAFPVERDIDLVVSYGMRAQMAKVTLHFREYGTGRTLVADDGSDSVTCECKVGDKPVIAFRHIEGYRPLYRNVTGTVTGDTDWYLDYIKDDGEAGTGTSTIAGGTSTQRQGTTAGGQDSGTATDGTGAATPGGAGADATGTGNATGNDGATANDAGSPAPSETGGGTTQVPEPEPETRTLLDNDTPLAGGDNANANGFDIGVWARAHRLPIAIGAGAFLAVLLSIIAFVIGKRSKRENQGQG